MSIYLDQSDIDVLIIRIRRLQPPAKFLRLCKGMNGKLNLNAPNRVNWFSK
jgi:predicted nucleotidyltransferase